MQGAEPRIETVPAAEAPRLPRVLKLRDLIFYGIVFIQPIAPVPLFGLAQSLSKGHMVTTLLVAMVAMMFTAFSYGRMAALYPAAGSAYTYVGRGLNPHLGFLTGWALAVPYLMVPLINTIYGAVALHRIIPAMPYAAWAALLAGSMTFLNLRGIRTTTRANVVLLVFMLLIIGAFIVLAIEYLVRLHGLHGLFSFKPFYDADSFDFHTVRTATSFAALTYIGFDSVTTLAEDVENPKRNVLLAVVLVCLFTGLFGGFLVYLGQLVWPDYRTFVNLETAFMDVAWRVGGGFLFEAMWVMLVVAMFSSALCAQAGASRLLFGMGRDRVLPHGFFAYLDPKRSTPVYTICIVGMVSFLGALVLNYERGAEILNFGAFLAFMGVNLAAMRQFYFLKGGAGKPGFLIDAVFPGLGFLFCFAIWWSLPPLAKIVGGLWALLGLVYDAVRSQGFRTQPVMIDFSES